MAQVVVYCILHVTESTGPLRRLRFKFDSLPVIPVAGDTFFWSDEWVGHTVEHRYVTPEYVELYIGRIEPSYVEQLLTLGWEL